ncbi:hypothetical protein A9Q99_07030 [Gammaproteobacteria bacterium 45_16_T64]|nr:hypothetical protein A9Q99_07030 [Gammaproteobacteria bacterium 45_16_T64]
MPSLSGTEIAELCAHSETADILRNCLKSDYATENVEFVALVNLLHGVLCSVPNDILTVGWIKLQPATGLNICKLIHDDYISDNGNNTVNVSFKTRKKISAAYAGGNYATYVELLFGKGFDEITKVLAQNFGYELPKKQPYKKGKSAINKVLQSNSYLVDKMDSKTPDIKVITGMVSTFSSYSYKRPMVAGPTRSRSNGVY